MWEHDYNTFDLITYLKKMKLFKFQDIIKYLGDNYRQFFNLRFEFIVEHFSKSYN